MINSVEYKLTKQPNTISEEVFEPNQNLLEFIKKKDVNNSRIIVIKASNSSGKSFLLNSIAYAFNALELSNDELSPTLRRSIKYLIDREHQHIDFKIDINDPDGFSLQSKFNYLNANEISMNKKDGSCVVIDQKTFTDRYKLLYDIPEKPLDRIYKLSKSIKDFNAEILKQLNPLDLKMLSVLRTIKDVRNETVIEDIQERIQDKTALANSYESKVIGLDKKLKDLENHKNLITLKRNITRFEFNGKEHEKISSELKKLKPISNKNIIIQNSKVIKDLKNEIRDLRISNLLIYCKEEIEENEYSNKFAKSFSENDSSLFNNLFENSESIISDLLVFDQEKINEFLNGLKIFKTISLQKVFKGLKIGLNEVDYKLVRNLKSDFIKYKEYEDGSDIINNLFDKNSDTIINELNRLEIKYSEIDKINNIHKELNDTLDKIISRVNKALKLSKTLYRAINKNNKGPKQKNLYSTILEKKNNLEDSIKKDSKEIQTLKVILEKDGISSFDLIQLNKINILIENLFVKNSYCRNKEKEKADEYKYEIKKFNSLISQLKKSILDDEVKFKIEDLKQSSIYAHHQPKIQLFSNKLSFFTKYLLQKDNLIDTHGELKISNSDEDVSYMKIIGEFVASLMGKKIIYQNSTVDIDFIDYTNTTPYFVTPKNKRIAFSDFSGGQGSSNYLKAKLNINEERKFIVLIDEIANMDDQSLDIVIGRLKELDNNNKLLLAILVEPVKEKNIFKIKTY